MHPTYLKAAYKKAILRDLQKVLEEQLLDRTGTAPRRLICEEVLYAHRVVGQDAIQDVFSDLEDLIGELDRITTRFDFRERTTDERPAGKKQQQQVPANPKPRAGGRKGRARAPEAPSE